MHPGDDQSLGLIYLLKCTELAVRACTEAALAPFELTPALFLMLFRLRESDGASSAELARAIGVRPQSVVELIKPLERARLIRRRQDPGHGRILRVSLTAAGERLLDTVIPTARRLESELLSGLTQRQIVALRAALEALLQKAQQHELHPRSKAAGDPAPRRKPAAD